jgi:uncharacterized protein (TIGR00266 family)
MSNLSHRILGHEMQYVEIDLAPGQAAVAEAGTMLYKDTAVDLATVFGDGSQQEGGVFGKLLGAGKRMLTGATLFTTVFTNQGANPARVAFAAPIPGTILALDLAAHGGQLICQKDSFLAAAKGVHIGLFFQRKIMAGLFGGDGFIMQRLEGEGTVFVHLGGAMVERRLAPGEEIQVDAGCVAAITSTIGFDVALVGGIKSALFGGEGLFFANLTGPGTVWLQSRPFTRLAARMQSAMPHSGSSGSGEGTVGGAVVGGLLGAAAGSLFGGGSDSEA